MYQNPPSKSNQTVQQVSGYAETDPPIQIQLPEPATSLSCVTSRTYSRTPIRKTKPPSCTLCRRRKIKCDRANPCSHCLRAGAVCVSSVPSGAPRGREGGRRRVDSELLDRIAKLESLVKHIEGGNTALISPVPAATDGNRTV